MEQQQFRETFLKELPILMQNDPTFRMAVLDITRTQYADKTETESRFDRMMDELTKNRLLLEQKMAEDRKKWAENHKELVKLTTSLQELEEKSDKRWEESQKRWEENHKELVKLTTSLQDLGKQYDQTLGALGTRWGLHSEASFRNALCGILKDISEDIEVVNVNEYDDEGVVFGHPDQVELDVILKNGILMICEIKSSVSKSDMYTFDRKVQFYQQKHNRQATRKIVISPMVDQYAKPVADKLGIEIYSHVGKANI
jgi:hypothetical protein